MIALTDNSRTLADSHPLLGARLVISWTCTRRACAVIGAPSLERARLVVAVGPLDRQHAVVEAFVEVGGARIRTLVNPTSRPCATTAAAGMIHMDIAKADGDRLLALSIAQDGARLVYAQTSLLYEAGMAAGAFDQPALQRLADARVAQLA